MSLLLLGSCLVIWYACSRSCLKNEMVIGNEPDALYGTPFNEPPRLRNESILDTLFKKSLLLIYNF
jgi:hypothetical protein